MDDMYTVSISVGYCVAKEKDGMCLEDFEKIADQRMYQDKENYYLSKGMNQRARDEVFHGIYDSYITIMKVNLDSGDVEVIKNDTPEEDMQAYLKKTDPSLLRRQFLDDKNKSVRLYDRRQVGDTYHKVMMEIIPKKEYCEEKPIVFIYVKDMEMI